LASINGIFYNTVGPCLPPRGGKKNKKEQQKNKKKMKKKHTLHWQDNVD
jgi:hypothetical protein